MALRLRRGVDSDRLLITPASGELLYVTDTGKIFVGDGTTVGGNPIVQLSDDTDPSLSGDLDLNNNNIVGTGNINIDGTITATGNINLGDDANDNINVGGEFTSSLVPNQDNAHSLGEPTKRWGNIWVSGANIDGHADIGTVYTSLIDDTSTVAWNPTTSTFTGNLVGNTTGYHTGDVTGSIFAIDSSPLLDAINGTLRVYTINTQKIQTEVAGDTLTLKTVDQPLLVQVTETRLENLDTNTRLTHEREYTGAISDADTLARITAKTKDNGGTVVNRWTDEISVAARTIVSGDPTAGTQNFANHLQIWNTGKVRINTETALGVQTEPDSNFDIYGVMKIQPLTAAPTSPVEGMITVADRVTWDPAAVGSGASYPVYYDGTTWNKMT